MNIMKGWGITQKCPKEESERVCVRGGGLPGGIKDEKVCGY